MVAAIAAVDELDRGCKEKGYTNVSPIPSDYATYKPVAVDGCKLAAAWKDVGKRYVELQTKGATKREAERLERRIDGVKKGDTIEAADHARLLDPSSAVESFRKTYDKGAARFGGAVDAAWFEPIKAAAAKYPKALEEAGKTSRWDKAANLKDAALAAVITADHAKGGQLPEGQVVRTGSFADWTVEKDVFGVPVKRTKNAMALVKIKGETYCRVYARGFESKYDGSWGKPFWYTAGATFAVSSCQ
jgi:hypothetical protein